MAYVLVDSCSMRKPSPIEVAVARFQLSQNCDLHDEVELVPTVCPGRKRVQPFGPTVSAAQPRTRRQRRCDTDDDDDDEKQTDDYYDDRGEMAFEREKQRAIMGTILELLQAAIVNERRMK